MIAYLQDKQAVLEDRSCTSHGATISTRYYLDHAARVTLARAIYFHNLETGEPNAQPSL